MISHVFHVFWLYVHYSTNEDQIQIKDLYLIQCIYLEFLIGIRYSLNVFQIMCETDYITVVFWVHYIEWITFVKFLQKYYFMVLLIGFPLPPRKKLSCYNFLTSVARFNSMINSWDSSVQYWCSNKLHVTRRWC